MHLSYLGVSPGGSDGKECACNARDPALIIGSGRAPGEGNGNPLQYFGLENPIYRGAWRVTYSAWGCEKSDMTKQLTFTFQLSGASIPCFLILSLLRVHHGVGVGGWWLLDGRHSVSFLSSLRAHHQSGCNVVA